MNNNFGKLEIIKTRINVGLEKPVTFLHITDTHIALDDPGSDSGRWKCFDVEVRGKAAYFFEKALEYAKTNGIPVVHTGDLLDFISDANYEYADRTLADMNYIYAAGNHDFCHCVGRAREDYSYKWENIKRTAPHFKSNLYFDSLIVGGVNIVTMDDSYYLISDGQTEMLRAEAAKGYPILLCMHVPVFTECLADKVYAKGNPCAYCTCPPQEHLERFSPERRVQQTPDDATKRAVDYIMSEPLIKAVITGHLHMNDEEILPNGVLQIVTHGSYAGYVREITIV